MYERVDFVAAELLASLQEIELQDEPEAGYLALERFHQFCDCCGGSPCCQHVVNDQDILAGSDGVLVDFKNVGAIFELILDPCPLGRQFLLLPYRDEAIAQGVGDGRSDDESPSLDAEHHVDGRGTIKLSQ